MKLITLYSSLAIGLFAAAGVHAAVTVGPLPIGTMCPSGSSTETKGRNQYCLFNDPNVIEAGIGRCDSNIPANMRSQSTVGRNTWCIIRKPVQNVNRDSSASKQSDVKAAPKEQPAESLKASRATEAGVSGALATASLCDPGEGIVFACNTGKKSVSVCASAKGVHYRFGLDRKSLDISLDAKGAGAGEYPLAGGGVWYYRFNNGNTSYVVYTAESSSMDKAGLVVEQGGKRTASLTCKNAATTNTALVGVAADTKGFEAP